MTDKGAVSEVEVQEPSNPAPDEEQIVEETVDSVAIFKEGAFTIEEIFKVLKAFG